MTPHDRWLQLLNSGYSPMPVNGKAPVLANWQTRPLTNVDEIQLWSRTFPNAGTPGAVYNMLHKQISDLPGVNAERKQRRRQAWQGRVRGRVVDLRDGGDAP